METSLIEVKPVDPSFIKELERQTEVELLSTRNIIISNQEEYDGAADNLKRVKATTKDLIARRKGITVPFDKAKKAVMDLFRKLLENLGRAEKALKWSLVAYDNDQERKRREQEEKLRRQAQAEERRKRKQLEERARKAEEKGDEEKAEELRDKAEEVHVDAPILSPNHQKPRGVSYRDHWYVVEETIDKSKLPLEYLEPNIPMLNKIAQATKGKLQIPGAEFRVEKIVASRAA